jgi:hypothetical protein
MAAILTLMGIAALVWAFVSAKNERAQEQALEKPVSSESHLAVQGGERLLTLDLQTQKKGDIASVRLAAVSHRQETKAYGRVLELTDLLDLRNRYAAARAQAEKARTHRDVSQKTVDRLQILHGQDRNISDRTLQEAQQSLQADEADEKAAQETLNSLDGIIRQQWGDVLANALSEDSPFMVRLIRRQDLLLQITLPSDVRSISAPQTARIETTGGNFIDARRVSPSPRTDPQIQGASFFYAAPSRSPLLPGMTVLAYLPAGSMMRGVLVPASAVVWWEGRAWAFLQRDGTHFTRRQVSTEAPSEGGWFEEKGFSPGDRVVIRGGEALLSEEFRARIESDE